MVPDPFDPAAEQAFVREVLDRQETAIDEFQQRLRCVPRMLAALNSRRGRPLDWHDLSDLGQDVVSIVLDKLPKYRAIAPLEGWIYQVCILEFMNATRRKGRRPPTRSLDESREGEMTGDVAPGAGDHDDVHLALERLGGIEAETIRLRYFDELTFSEIGARMGVSDSTAKTRYRRGMAKLEHYLRTFRDKP